MLEEEILQKIEAQKKKLEEIYRSVERTRKYFLWTLIAMVALIILSLIAGLFLITQILSDINSGVNVNF